MNETDNKRVNKSSALKPTKGALIASFIIATITTALGYVVYLTDSYRDPLFWIFFAIQMVLVALMFIFRRKTELVSYIAGTLFFWPFIIFFIFSSKFPENFFYGVFLSTIIIFLVLIIYLLLTAAKRKAARRREHKNTGHQLAREKPTLAGKITDIIFTLFILFLLVGYIFRLLITDCYKYSAFWVLATIEVIIFYIIFKVDPPRHGWLVKILAGVFAVSLPVILGVTLNIRCLGIFSIIFLISLILFLFIISRFTTGKLTFDPVLPRGLPEYFGEPEMDKWEHNMKRVSHGIDIIYSYPPDDLENTVWIQESDKSIDWTISGKKSIETAQDIGKVHVIIRQELDRKKNLLKPAFTEAKWKKKEIYFDLRTQNLDITEFNKVLNSLF